MRRLEQDAWADTPLARQAAWVCAHPAFEASERLARLLCHLVRRTIEAPEARITQIEIATAVMDCDASFDPAVDAHVRIEVGRLRKALELFYARLDEPCAVRVEIPKGGYRPVLRSIGEARTSRSSSRPNRLPTVAFADLGWNDVAAAEIAFLATEDAYFRCQLAPLVRSGALALARLPKAARSDSVAAARRLGAGLVLHGDVRHAEGRLRACLSLVDTAAETVLWCKSLEGGTTEEAASTFADSIAGTVATQIADPLLGRAPRALAATTRDLPLGVLMGAFDFMATQDFARVAPVISSLRRLRGSDRLLAISQGLLADLLRVATNTRTLANAASPAECVDLALSAVDHDPGNATARLALGYALLNSGEKPCATGPGIGCAVERGIHSLRADWRLLGVLGDVNSDRGSLVSASADSDSVPEPLSGFFMDEFATILPLFAKGELVAAATLLEGSVNDEIFWLHLFRAAVYDGLGEPALARRSRDRLSALLPNLDQVIRPTVTGFFPSEAMREMLLVGLRRSGLRLL